MVQIVKQATPWGEVAGGFGKGIGEAIEDVSTRYVTNRGINQIMDATNQGQQLSRLQIYQGLLNIPGMTPERAQMYLPAIEDNIRRQAAARTTTETPSNQGGEVSVTGTEVMTEQAEAPDRFALKPSSDVQRLATMVDPDLQSSFYEMKMEGSPQQVRDVANKLYNQNPGLYMTYSDAEKEATDLINAQNAFIDNKQSLAKRKSEITDEIKTRLETQAQRILQRSNLQDMYAEIPGTILQNIENKLVAEAQSTNASPQTLADRGAREILEFARAKNGLDQMPTRPWIGKGPENQIEQLKEYRKFYERYDALPEYKAEIMKKGYSEPFAASLAYPLSTAENKAIASYKQKHPKPLSVSTDRRADPNRIARKKDKRTEALTRSLANNFGPDTSLQTQALMMYDLELNPSKYYEVMADLVDSGRIELNDRQANELAKRDPVVPTLDDLYNTLPGKGTRRTQFGFWESLARRLGK